MLLDEVVEVFEGEALTTFAAALQRRLQEAAAAKVGGRAGGGGGGAWGSLGLWCYGRGGCPHAPCLLRALHAALPPLARLL